MHCRCEKGHGLGNPVPLRVRAAARHVAHKSKIVRNELNLVNQKLNPVTRRSLAILPIILPVMPLTVDGEPKTMPEAKPCCQHGLMAAIKAAGTGDTVLIPGGT